MDISCVITLHNEGVLAYRTVSSVRNAISYAKQRKINCEIIAVADRPSEETIQFISSHLAQVNVEQVNFRDPGLSRNYGIKKSKGKYISILDGDDLISENWLFEAVRLAQASESSILHPQYNIFSDQTPVSQST